jgi:hypothetical protein
MFTIDDLVELAKEVDLVDPTDWEELNLSPDQAYKLIASSMLEYFSDLENDKERLQMLLITAVRLTVENFVLNLKLLKK